MVLVDDSGLTLKLRLYVSFLSGRFQASQRPEFGIRIVTFISRHTDFLTLTIVSAVAGAVPMTEMQTTVLLYIL